MTAVRNFNEASRQAGIAGLNLDMKFMWFDWGKTEKPDDGTRYLYEEFNRWSEGACPWQKPMLA